MGINTDSPQATLHIATPATPTTTNNGGMVLENPQADKSTLFSSTETYSDLDLYLRTQDLQNQNILVQDNVTGNVNHMGRHAFTYAPARPYSLPIFGPQPINKYDYNILVQQDFTLPNNAEFTAKILNLTYSSSTGAAFTVSGPIQWNGQVIPSIELNRASSAYTLQFNGTRWIVIDGFNASSAGRIRTMSTGTVGMTDGTILVTGSVNLPAANLYPGREFRFVYHGGTASVISPNDFILSGSTIGTNYGLNTGENGKGITVQSNGTNWIVVSRF